MEAVFQIGMQVETLGGVRIDYSDCLYKGIYKIPAGSVGTVVSLPLYINGQKRIAVRFDSVPNYPELVFGESEPAEPIGPGHYISLGNLVPFQGTEGEELASMDIEALF